MERLKLTFGDDPESSLFWNIRNTPASQHWLALLRTVLGDGTGVSVRSRYNGFPGHRDFVQISKELMRTVSLLNMYAGNIIEIRDVIDQDYLNYLHHHFEVFSGSIESPGEFVRNAPPTMLKLNHRLNELIHETESVQRTGTKHSVLYLDIIKQPALQRIPLSHSEFEEFTTAREFGDIYLRYCLLGKSLQCAFWDGDSHVGRDNIRPLDHMTGEFNIYFGISQPETIDDPRHRKLRQWCDKEGFDVSDSRLAIGELYVANLDRKRGKGVLEREQLIEWLGKMHAQPEIEIVCP